MLCNMKQVLFLIAFIALSSAGKRHAREYNYDYEDGFWSKEASSTELGADDGKNNAEEPKYDDIENDYDLEEQLNQKEIPNPNDLESLLDHADDEIEKIGSSNVNEEANSQDGDDFINGVEPEVEPNAPVKGDLDYDDSYQVEDNRSEDEIDSTYVKDREGKFGEIDLPDESGEINLGNDMIDPEEESDSFENDRDTESIFDETQSNDENGEMSLKFENDMIVPAVNSYVSINNDAQSIAKTDEKEDTVADVYQDLNADVDKLLATMAKLTENSGEDDVVEKYEEKYEKPFGEDAILAQRENLYSDYDDENYNSSKRESNINNVKSNDEVDEIVDNNPKTNASNMYEENKDVLQKYIPKESNEEKFNVEISLDNIDNKEQKQVDFSEHPSIQQHLESNPPREEDWEYCEDCQDMKPKNGNESEENDNYMDDLGISDVKYSYLKEDSEEYLNRLQAEFKDEMKEDPEDLGATTVVTYRTISVDDLTHTQYNDLMAGFSEIYAAELDTASEDFGKNIAAVHMTLDTDNAIEITSPNYPNAYPTNNIVDWVLDGEGSGIEMNITDLDIRGVQGDFLLIKPGGLDVNSGENALVFSYHLTEPRRFRFTDVNSVYIRFQSGSGLAFQTGFRLTVKLIRPLEPESDEDLPDSEPLEIPLPATHTVTLGGIMYPVFEDISEDFRTMLADMAAMYINANGVEPGLNATSETAVITNVATCNINWPDFEKCVQVTFGIPLVYEDNVTRLNQEDLEIMWETYSGQDPFLARMRTMGIENFRAPDDSKFMMMWVLVAVAAIITAGMVGFALWKFSCSENYTRMSNGDLSSLYEEKCDPGLYPTPHQDLPALYNDPKWNPSNDTRVDVGGIPNQGYVRRGDDILDFDSEDEVVATHNRNDGFSPRDLYKV